MFFRGTSRVRLQRCKLHVGWPSSCLAVDLAVLKTLRASVKLHERGFVAFGRQAAWRPGAIVVGPCRQAAWWLGKLRKRCTHETRATRVTPEQPSNRATTRPLDHSTTPPLHHSTTRPLDHSTTRPLDHSTTRPLDHSTTQPLNHSTTQPLNHSTTQPLNQSTNQPINQSTQQPSNQANKQPSNQITKQPLNQSTNQPINQHATTAGRPAQVGRLPCTDGEILEPWWRGLRSWSRSWKLSPFPSFTLWSRSRNSGGGPVLFRQRGGRQVFFAVPQTPFIGRVVDTPVVRARLVHGVQSVLKTVGIPRVVDVPVITQLQFQQSKSCVIVEVLQIQFIVRIVDFPVMQQSAG